MDWAELVLADTGIGISVEDLPHLFDRFHRGRNAAPYLGSGLGLTIVQAIVARHGGTVQAENWEAGAQFMLRPPIIRTLSTQSTSRDISEA